MHNPDSALPLFAQTSVAIAPVQTEMVIAQLTINGKQMIGIQAVTPTGVAFYFLDSEQAKKVGQALLSVASGIIITPNLLVNGPTNGHSMMEK